MSSADRIGEIRTTLHPLFCKGAQLFIGAIDPSASDGKCGWAWMELNHGALAQVHHGADDVAGACAHLLSTPRLDAVAIEEPHLVAVGNQWRVAWAGGEAFGRLADHLVYEHRAWFPKAASWRAVLGLNSAGGSRKRKDVNEAVCQWVRASFRIPTVTADEANALAMCEALRYSIEHNAAPRGKKGKRK